MMVRRCLTLYITTEKIEKHLLGLNPNKSAGPDGIHSRLLKETATEIAKPLKEVHI
jgi:hypothetical protein